MMLGRDSVENLRAIDTDSCDGLQRVEVGAGDAPRTGMFDGIQRVEIGAGDAPHTAICLKTMCQSALESYDRSASNPQLASCQEKLEPLVTGTNILISVLSPTQPMNDRYYKLVRVLGNTSTVLRNEENENGDDCTSESEFDTSCSTCDGKDQEYELLVAPDVNDASSE